MSRFISSFLKRVDIKKLIENYTISSNNNTKTRIRNQIKDYYLKQFTDARNENKKSQIIKTIIKDPILDALFQDLIDKGIITNEDFIFSYNKKKEENARKIVNYEKKLLNNNNNKINYATKIIHFYLKKFKKYTLLNNKIQINNLFVIIIEDQIVNKLFFDILDKIEDSKFLYYYTEKLRKNIKDIRLNGNELSYSQIHKIIEFSYTKKFEKIELLILEKDPVIFGYNNIIKENYERPPRKINLLNNLTFEERLKQIKNLFNETFNIKYVLKSYSSYKLKQYLNYSIKSDISYRIYKYLDLYLFQYILSKFYYENDEVKNKLIDEILKQNIFILFIIHYMDEFKYFTEFVTFFKKVVDDYIPNEIGKLMKLPNYINKNITNVTELQKSLSKNRIKANKINYRIQLLQDLLNALPKKKQITNNNATPNANRNQNRKQNQNQNKNNLNTYPSAS
jgi:hypothetical protein